MTTPRRPRADHYAYARCAGCKVYSLYWLSWSAGWWWVQCPVCGRQRAA